MKLRSKFFLIILSILVIPFCISLLSFIIQIKSFSEDYNIQDLRELQQWLQLDFPVDGGLERINMLVDHAPEKVEILVVDNNSLILYSGIGSFEENDFLTINHLTSYIRKHSNEFIFQLLDHPFLVKYEYSLFLQFPRIDFLFEKMRKQMAVSSLVTVMILLATAIISIIVIRNFSRSVILLDQATKKISGGNLDFELKSKGNDELADLTKSFNIMRKSLKEEYTKRSRFLMGVSHDLKTPLALIEGYVEAIMDGLAGDPEKERHYLSIIKDKSKLLESRISDLIEYVKLETREWKMNHQEVSLLPFLKQITLHYEKDASLMNRSFNYDISISPERMIKMDKNLFERVLENIINNAFRYTREGDHILFEATENKSRILITIRDTGAGMESGEVSQIFDPFFRGSSSRRESGSGLGLSTAKSIILAHGWKIAACSAVGEGMWFNIEIPLV